ncbi:transcriptional regulator [Qipengyuania sp. GH1]|uniref:winged helix-turn-helix domain-containing protein n=1 Tax=Qipengyuania aestuarii TaxID=2867241 RepID=UPI001C885D9C|nr:transcriptional regulator [Qipengyuania aestuarii]MBX7535307.1 transcriptional regulator [Qipengyuania aestuarii]
MDQGPGLLAFGAFTLDIANRQLRRGGEVIELGSRYFNALVLLARHPGELVSKDRFMEEVWAGIPVTDEALTQCIRSLRRTLGDAAQSPRFIETVPKHGYRFVAQVEAVAAPSRAYATKAGPASPAARIAGATTLGGLGAGLLGGVFYGMAATGGDVAAVLTVILLTTALAVLGAAGIGTGMALASLWRGEGHWSLIFGGAAGGLVVGALGSALASHGLHSLTGVFPGRVMGLYEGMALGAATGLAIMLGVRAAGRRFSAALLAMVSGGAFAAVAALAGGTFYAATLALLARQFPASSLNLSPLARLFGESGMGPAALLGTAILEGAVFTACLALANELAKSRAARRGRGRAEARRSV